jgi:CHAD domain-containing protein
VRVAPPGTDASGDGRFLRVEVECTAVKPRAIAGWVHDFREAADLEPATCSKYGKALAMTGLEPPGAVELGPTAIEPSMPAQEAQLAIFRRYFAQVLDREPGTRMGENAEELHGMRVSARRLAAAARLFHAFSPQWAADSLPALASLTRALGKVRDSDVYCECLDRLAARLAPGLRKVLRPLRSRAEQDRARARRRLLTALDSQRLQKVWSEWIQQLRAQPSPQPGGEETAIGSVARQLIRRRYRKLRKRAEHLNRKSTAEELHAVRRRAKRLRYAVEALGDLYGEPAAKFARAVERLQDVLGTCQDARVRSERTAALAQANAASFPPETLYMMGRLVERDSLAARDSRAKLKSAMKKVRGRRWRAMREAMDAVALRPRL